MENSVDNNLIQRVNELKLKEDMIKMESSANAISNIKPIDISPNNITPVNVGRPYGQS